MDADFWVLEGERTREERKERHRDARCAHSTSIGAREARQGARAGRRREQHGRRRRGRLWGKRGIDVESSRGDIKMGSEKRKH